MIWGIFAAWPRSTMDSMRVSEAPDTGSIPVEATLQKEFLKFRNSFCIISKLQD
jgi:hypothetical protein